MGRHSSSNHSPSSRRDHRSHHNLSPPPPPPPPPRDKHEHSGRDSLDSSPLSRSPSSRTKQLKRAQSERERNHDSSRERGLKRDAESERIYGGSRGRGSEREKKRMNNDDSSGRSNKSEKRTENDDGGGRSNKSSRSRHQRSPELERNGRHRHRSQSPSHHPASANAKPRDEMMNPRGAEQMDDEDDSISKMKAAEEALEEKQKQKPSFELSGNLAAETNRVRGITLLFNEPPEARKPDIKWRLYVFKAGEVLNEPLYIHRQSCYLFGRERRVADIPTDHPSCSKQHAVIQFRQVEKEQPDGTLLKKVRPYIMDLGSTNKTFINDSPIEPQRYYELREKDTIKFGNSSREYVLLHENSIG